MKALDKDGDSSGSPLKTKEKLFFRSTSKVDSCQVIVSNGSVCLAAKPIHLPKLGLSDIVPRLY